MVKLAVDAITGFSVKTITRQLVACRCRHVAGNNYRCLRAGILVIFRYRALASLVVIIVLFSSAQLLCLGILGEYVGRLFMQSKGRPLAIVREVVSKPVNHIEAK